MNPFLAVLVNPDAFFRQGPAAWAGLKIPALVVLVQGLIAAVIAYMVSGITLAMMPEEVQGMQSVIQVVGAGTALAGSFVIWVVWTAVFFAISLIFQGRGEFRTALAAVGYGFVPTIIGGIVNLVIYAVYLPTITVPRVTDVYAIQESMAGFMHHPIMVTSALIGVLFTLWSANIWIFAVRESRGIPAKKAALTVLVPVFLYILITVYSLMVFG